MVLQLGQSPRIEDLRHHAPESVEALRVLLERGAPARPDPRRKDFYEVENCNRVFYIHITPQRRVLLLAIWPKEGEPASAPADAPRELAAPACPR